MVSVPRWAEARILLGGTLGIWCGDLYWCRAATRLPGIPWLVRRVFPLLAVLHPLAQFLCLLVCEVAVSLRYLNKPAPTQASFCYLA